MMMTIENAGRTLPAVRGTRRFQGAIQSHKFVLGPEPVVLGVPPSPRALPNRNTPDERHLLVNLIGHVNGFGSTVAPGLRECVAPELWTGGPICSRSVSVLVRLEVIE